MVYSAKSDDTDTISQFTRRKAIKITTTGTSTPVLYQTKVTISSEPGMQSLFQDIRFNTKAGVYIDYWIESKTSSTTAEVWLELPDAITDGNSDTIWMYYGNTGLSDGGVGVDTFLQYHGATATGFIDSFVVSPANVVYEGKLKRSGTTNILWGLADTSFMETNRIYVQTHTNNNLRYVGTSSGGSHSSISETPQFPDNTWVRAKITCDGTTVYGYIDDNEISSGGIMTNIPTTNLGLGFREATGSAEQEWSFVRKYIANEPTASYGTPQHQRITAQFV